MILRSILILHTTTDFLGGVGGRGGAGGGKRRESQC